jgi:hypothetical protein
MMPIECHGSCGTDWKTNNAFLGVGGATQWMDEPINNIFSFIHLFIHHRERIKTKKQTVYEKNKTKRKRKENK